jgi:hypothetical protein
VNGFISLPKPLDWRPSPELLEFVERGPAPLYIGFGSMNFLLNNTRFDMLLDVSTLFFFFLLLFLFCFLPASHFFFSGSESIRNASGNLNR